MTQFYDHNPGVAVASNRTRWLVIFRNDSSVAITGKSRSLFLGETLGSQRERDKEQANRARLFIIWG